MNEYTEIALASSVKNQPNVRIVNFLYPKAKECLFLLHLKGIKKLANLIRIIK